MKNIFKSILLLGCAAMCCVSCNLLDLPIRNSIEKRNFYKTPSDIDLATTGAYGLLSQFYRQGYVHLAELPGDNAYTGGETSDLGRLDKFAATPVNSRLKVEWGHAYKCITNINEVLAAIPNITFVKDGDADQYVGELKFIRALSYFNMVRVFGDLPMITAPITLEDARKLTRTPADDIYDEVIIPDLLDAFAKLPETYPAEKVGHATKWSAASLLGSVYLTRHNYTDAEAILKQVIESKKYRLLDDYAAIFDPNNANHAESIFEIQFEKTRTGGSFWSCAAHSRELADEFGISTAASTLPTQSIIEALDPSSARYEATIGIGVKKPVNYIKKHFMEISIQNHSDDNWPVLRYADVLLMYAEALNELNATPAEDAIKYINQIRRRAYGLDINVESPEHDLSAAELSSQDTFRHAIWNERRLELAFEGHRWFDLVRTGEYVTVMNQHFADEFDGVFHIEDYNKIFPVPQYEIDVNPNLLPNNPGYF